MSNIAIGVDIGGTHISSLAFDLSEERILENTFSTQKVNEKSPKNEIIELWCNTIQSSIEKCKLPIKGIGIAMPGPFDYANGIGLFNEEVNHKFQNLYGVNIKNEIKQTLSLSDSIPIRFINDASAFGIGEAWKGQAVGFENVMAITLGTGLGSAFLKNGVPVLDGESVPKMGCVYHLPYKDSNVDDYFSTRWFLNSYRKKTGRGVKGVKELAENIEKDEVTKSLFYEFGSNLGNFLAFWLKKFDAQSLVIGGNISNSFPLFEAPFREIFIKQGIKIDIGISKLKENASIVGSCRIIDEDYFKKIETIIDKM